MMKTKIIALLFVFLLFSVFGCTQNDDSSELNPVDGIGDHQPASHPIINGYAPDAPEHDAVVSLHQLDPRRGLVYVQPFCSGTLIEPDVVITAAHCLDVAKGVRPTFQTLVPEKLAIYVGDNPSTDILSHLYFVSETIIYSGYNRLALRNDIALVRLSGPISEPVASVPYLDTANGFTSADVGGLLNFAGFGQTETGDSGVKLQADGILGSLGCYVYGCPDAGDAATQIAYNQYSSGPCFGDSGGPAFVYRNGSAYVGGLTSYGDSNCAVYGVSTRVDAFDGWIYDFIYGPPAPDCSADGVCNADCAIGEDPDCSTPIGDCGNDVCDEGESCDGRYDTEACLVDCPGKTVGTPKKQYCYVGDVCEGLGCP